MGLKGLAERLTGRTVEEKLNEYSEVYGEVLLGMHRNLQKHSVAIKNHENCMQQGLAKVAQSRIDMTKDVAKVEEFLAEVKKCKDNVNEYRDSASIASQAAVNAAASAAKECIKIANGIEQRFTTKFEKQEQQLEKLRNEYRQFRSRVTWVLGSTSALGLIGVIAWILRLRG